MLILFPNFKKSSALVLSEIAIGTFRLRALLLETASTKVLTGCPTNLKKPIKKVLFIFFSYYNVNMCSRKNRLKETFVKS